MNRYKDELLYEFRGEENSFLINIRCHIKWTHDSFINLVRTMMNYCKNRDCEENLDKEVTEGFWYVSWFIKDWTSHENFRKANRFSSDYFDQAYEIIFNLAYWYFMQDSPFTSDEIFDNEIKELEKLMNIE